MVKFSRAPCGLTTLSKHSWLSFLKLDPKSPIQRVLRIPRTGLEEIWTQVGRPQVAWQNAGAIPNRTVCGPLDSCSKTLCIIASDWLMTWVNTLSMIVGLFWHHLRWWSHMMNILFKHGALDSFFNPVGLLYSQIWISIKSTSGLCVVVDLLFVFINIIYYC